MGQRGSSFVAVAQIAEAIQPVARGIRYEDPLAAALKEAGLGSVRGGGSLLGRQRQIASVDIELALRDLEGALQFARTTLLALGAPVGSKLLFLRNGRPRALVIATGEELDHEPALEALARRLALPQIDDGEEEDDDEQARVQAAARKILKDFESLWAGSFDYPPADLASYPADWVGWYDRMTQALAPLDFIFLGDIATVRTDLPVPRSFGFSRKFLSRDGLTRVDVFQSPRPQPASPLRVFAFKTDFDGGRCLATSNAVARWNVPDFIDDERLTPESSVAAVAERHLARLAAAQPAGSSRAMHCSSIAEVLASEEHERARTRRFRQQQQVPTASELERLGAQPEFAALVHAEMRRLAQCA